MRPATLLLLPAAATAFVAPHNASPSFSHSSPATSVPTVTSPLQQTAAGLARMGMSSNSSGDPEVPVSRRKKKEKAKKNKKNKKKTKKKEKKKNKEKTTKKLSLIHI